MSEYDERTIPVTLDGLDYEAPVLGGLTYKELIFTVFFSFLVTLPITLPASYLLFGTTLLAPIVSAVLMLFITRSVTKKIYILKKDRPSYLVWVGLQKQLQNQGIFGLKIPMGFIKTTHWHTGITKD